MKRTYQPSNLVLLAWREGLAKKRPTAPQPNVQ